MNYDPNMLRQLLKPDPPRIVKVPSHQRVYSKKKQILGKISPSTLPTSYSTHTAKEETILEYVEDFRRQFVQVFPKRRPLFLCPQNEANIHKFVCTTICPTLLPYQEIHNLQACANFVIDFFEYLPLDEATVLPEVLPSPSTMLRTRAGDCFDFAVFLCSLLRGCGYNAYCVSGYAPQYICNQDLTSTECPLLNNEPDFDGSEDKWWGFDKYTRQAEENLAKLGFPSASTSATAAANTKKEVSKVEDGDDEEGAAAAADEGGTMLREKYTVPPPPVLASKFIEKLEFERKEMEAMKKKEEEDERLAKMKKKKDPLEKDRVHCWILIMKGRRDVQQDIFVEPTTATVYPVHQAPYVGIESVWNETNYWVNVQSAKMEDMKYDLNQNSSWEYVLIDERRMDDKPSGGGSSKIGGFDREDDIDKRKHVAEDDDDKDILDVPMTWCKQLEIDRATYRSRFPSRRKLIQYQRCVVEKYSEFYEGGQGLVQQITLFNDDNNEHAREIRSVFKHREDKLLRRFFFPMEERSHEYYAPGREQGVREFITVSNKQRMFKFDPSARQDGMVGRVETLGLKVVEIYQNRDDFLIYRSVTVDPNMPNRNLRSMISSAKHTIVLGRGAEYPIRKITEKYGRNLTKHAEHDVMKRTHFLTDGLIRLDYHYNKNFVVHSTHMIDKDDKTEPRLVTAAADVEEPHAPPSRSFEYRVDPNWKQPSPGQRKDELTRLLTRERELITKVKNDEDNISKLVIRLEEEKLHTKLVKSIYDVAQDQSIAGEKEKKTSAEKTDKITSDYLTPFLGNYTPGKPLKGRQAQTARDLCLAATKERLLERANVIQAHLDSENQKLHLQQNQFKRQAANDSGDKDAQQITKAYDDSVYRIGILKKRVEMHEEQAVKKFVAMEKRLNEDPRLEILRQTE